MLSCVREQLACSAVVNGCRIPAEHCSWNVPCMSLQAALCREQVAEPLRLRPVPCMASCSPAVVPMLCKQLCASDNGKK